MEDRILVKTREDLIGRMEYFKIECAEAEEGLLLPDMLLNFYMYACAWAAQCCIHSENVVEIDWERVLTSVDSTIQDDGIYERQELDDLRECVLSMQSAGLIPEDVLSVFTCGQWSFADLVGRIHGLALRTIDFYAQLNGLGNPYASSELTLPVVLRIQHVMNETVFNVPLYAYWWAVYLVTEGKKVLSGDYWERDLSDPMVLRVGLQQLLAEIEDMAREGFDFKRVVDYIYDEPVPWKDVREPLWRGLECLEAFAGGEI